ncbi:MAG: hypothetical protein LBM99_00235 [Bacillales bacterium]|jgi:DNA polymerase-3 subunit delta'|nr:hypothetical protein [Bacillales bacterium]
MNQQIREILQKQTIPYSIIENSFNNKSFLHAYLIEGGAGTPLFSFAFFLAKAILCTGETLVCDKCSQCLRMEHDRYPDFQIINAEKNTINREQLEDLQDVFSLKAVEPLGKKVYIIHHIDNIPSNTLNILLKFIEEPVDEIYAIFTTLSKEKVLPTISSRCQVLRLYEVSSKDLSEQLINEGWDEDESYIYANVTSNLEEAKSIKTDDGFLKIKDLVFDLIDKLAFSDDALYYLQTYGYLYIKDTQTCRLFLSVFSLVFKDIILIKNNLPFRIKALEKANMKLAERFINPEEIYSSIIITTSYLSINANISLLLDSLFIKIKGGLK